MIGADRGCSQKITECSPNGRGCGIVVRPITIWRSLGIPSVQCITLNIQYLSTVGCENINLSQIRPCERNLTPGVWLSVPIRRYYFIHISKYDWDKYICLNFEKVWIHLHIKGILSQCFIQNKLITALPWPNCT